MNNFSSVLVRPVITEKSTNAGSDNFYTFIVAKSANKHTIKQALKKFYDVDAISINTLIMYHTQMQACTSIKLSLQHYIIHSRK